MACILVSLERAGGCSVSLERDGSPMATVMERIGPLTVSLTLECKVSRKYLYDANGVPVVTVDGHLLLVKS